MKSETESNGSVPVLSGCTGLDEDEYEVAHCTVHCGLTEFGTNLIARPATNVGGTRSRLLDTSLGRELATGPQKGRRNEVY